MCLFHCNESIATGNCSAKTMPSVINTEDVLLGTARDLTGTLKEIQKGYAE